MTLNLIVIFNSFTDISFSKYVTKIFCVSYYFQKKIWKHFKVQLSVAVFVYILSSKGANQLHVLYIRTLGNIREKFPTEATVLKCIPSNFFPETRRIFRTTSEKLALENYVLAFHRADKDCADLLWNDYDVPVLITSLLNINFIRNKFGDLDKIVDGNIDILCRAETKLDESFPNNQFLYQYNQSIYTGYYRKQRWLDGIC